MTRPHEFCPPVRSSAPDLEKLMNRPDGELGFWFIERMEDGTYRACYAIPTVIGDGQYALMGSAVCHDTYCGKTPAEAALRFRIAHPDGRVFMYRELRPGAAYTKSDFFGKFKEVRV